MVLLKHVRTCILSYHLLILSINKQGFQDLEQTCRQFLWGINLKEKTKKHLVAWKEIAKKKTESSLDIQPFEAQAQALKMRCVEQILNIRNCEWTILAKSFIYETLKVGLEKKERCQWNA